MKKFAFGAILLVLSISISAHQDIQLPTPTWCTDANTRANVVGSFTFSTPEILAMKACLIDPTTCETSAPALQEAPGDDGGACKDCGNVNDDWTAARQLAANSCDQYAIPGGSGDIGSVIFIVPNDPIAPNDPKDPHDPIIRNFNLPGQSHHSAYRAIEGLGGNCVRCDSTLAE